MKILMPVFHKNTMTSKVTGVWGDELVVNYCCKLFTKLGHECTVEQIDEISGHYDIAIYLSYNMTNPMLTKHFADKNVLWLQGFNYSENRIKIVGLDEIYNCVKPFFDLIVTSAKKQANMFNIPYILPPVDFDIYKPVESTCNYDITFIGNLIKPYQVHEKFLSPFANFNYGLFGGDFGKVSHEKWLDIVCGSKINLHFGFDEGVEWDMPTSSALNIPACGGFLMTDRIPELVRIFGDNICYTSGGDDEREKIKYYLENEDVRRKMSSRAFEIVKSLNFDAILDIVKGV